MIKSWSENACVCFSILGTSAKTDSALKVHWADSQSRLPSPSVPAADMHPAALPVNTASSDSWFCVRMWVDFEAGEKKTQSHRTTEFSWRGAEGGGLWRIGDELWSHSQNLILHCKCNKISMLKLAVLNSTCTATTTMQAGILVNLFYILTYFFYVFVAIGKR